MLQLIKFVIISLIALLIAAGALFLVVNFVAWHGGNIVAGIVTGLLYSSVIIMMAGMAIVCAYHNYKMFKLYGEEDALL